MKISVSIAWDSKLQETGEKVRDAAEMAIKDTVLEIENTAKQLSPVLTGNNMRSIESSADGLEGKVYSTSGYGGYLELGTSKMPAQPYFKPALEENFTEDKFAEKIEANL